MSYIIYTTKPIFRTVLTIFPQCRLVLDLCQSNWCARLTCGSFRITDYLHQTMVSLTSSLGFLFSSSLGRRSMCGCCLISEVNAHQTWPKKLNKTKRVKFLWSPHALSSFKSPLIKPSSLICKVCQLFYESTGGLATSAGKKSEKTVKGKTKLSQSQN